MQRLGRTLLTLVTNSQLEEGFLHNKQILNAAKPGTSRANILNFFAIVPENDFNWIDKNHRKQCLCLFWELRSTYSILARFSKAKYG